MKVIAIQISGDRLDWSRVPDPLSFDEENESSHEFQAWPRLRPYSSGNIPRDMEERLLTYNIVASVIEDADEVYFAVANDADHRRVGIAEVALEAEGCSVTVSKPHPEGAAGIVRALVEDLVSTTPRPPGI